MQFASLFEPDNAFNLVTSRQVINSNSYAYGIFFFHFRNTSNLGRG